MAKKRVSLFKLVAIICIAVGPGSTWATGLYDYYLKALAADPDYAAARALHERDAKSADLAKAAFMPSINLAASGDNTKYLRTDAGATSAQRSEYKPNSVSLRITQPLFSMDRLAYKQENEARAAMAQWVLAQARQDLAQRLVQSYLNYLLGQDQLALAQAQVQAYEAQLKQLEGLLVSRSSTRTDVADARSRHELAKVQVRQAQSQLEVRRLEFAKLTGEVPVADLPTLDVAQPLLAPEPLDPVAWIEGARNSSFKVLAMQLGVQVAQAGIRRAGAANYPSLAVVGSSQRGRNPNYFTAEDRTDSISLQLNMNVFDGGTTRAQVAQAVSQEDYARNQLLSAQQDAGIAAGQAFWGVANGVEQVKALEKAEAAATLALEGMRMGIKANVKTYADELNAVQLLYATRRDLQKERYAYWLSRVQLLSSAGMQDAELHNLLRQMVR